VSDWHYHIRRTLIQTPITDVHTHLYDPCFAGLNRSGLDDLLVQPDLVVETCRVLGRPLGDFQALPTAQQAAQIWQSLFVDNSPLSDSTRAILAVIQGLGLNVNERNYQSMRQAFPSQAVDMVLGISGVTRLVMSNDPFHEKERALWQTQPQRDPRFYASLNLDAMVCHWGDNWARMKPWGYKVGPDFSQVEDISRFLDTWVDRTNPLYCSVSLKGDFSPAGEPGRIFRKYVIPLCQRRGLALALLEGRGLGALGLVEELCGKYPALKILASFPDRAEHTALLGRARHLPNLLPLGWMTGLPLSRLGNTSLAQHSAATVLEQLVGRWVTFKSVVVEQLVQTYNALESMGYQVEPEQIERDLKDLLGDNFWRFLGR